MSGRRKASAVKWISDRYHFDWTNTNQSELERLRSLPCDEGGHDCYQDMHGICVDFEEDIKFICCNKCGEVFKNDILKRATNENGDPLCGIEITNNDAFNEAVYLPKELKA